MLFNISFKNKLRESNYTLLSVYTALAAFSTYSCMYAFRKPFAVATFQGYTFCGIDYKIWLIIVQLIGYTTSKYYGIKFISEMKGHKRALYILIFIAIAWVSLLLFALTPRPFNIFFLFTDGFPLGMIWGLVFSYLEGKRSTDFMGAVLCTSFIFSSGFVKSVGDFTMLYWHISEFWMPFVTGSIFIIPLVISVFLLEQIPPPDAKDEQMRTIRAPMNKVERKKFIRTFWLGLIFLIAIYVLLTVIRDLRDNFAADIYLELGITDNADIFTTTEIPISIVILLSMSLLVLVKNNFKAFIISHFFVIGGLLICGISTWIFFFSHKDPILWMILTGLGLYFGYVPFNYLLFDRLIATFKHVSNIGFIIYVADSSAYSGSIIVLLLKHFAGLHLTWKHFYMDVLFFVSVIGIALAICSIFYFRRKYKHRSPAEITSKAEPVRFPI